VNPDRGVYREHVQVGEMGLVWNVFTTRHADGSHCFPRWLPLLKRPELLVYLVAAGLGADSWVFIVCHAGP
jgi:hypothetical protein